jgi:hypothetical protein
MSDFNAIEMIQFDLTAAQLEAVDATPLVFYSGNNVAGAVLVPEFATFHLFAGDAYTIGAGARIEIEDEDGNDLISIAAEGFLDQTTEQRRWVKSQFTTGKFSSNTYALQLSVEGGVGTIAKGTASGNLRVVFYFRRVYCG